MAIRYGYSDGAKIDAPSPKRTKMKQIVFRGYLLSYKNRADLDKAKVALTNDILEGRIPRYPKWD